MRPFLILLEEYPYEKIARTKTRDTEHSEHSGKHTRKIKQTGLGLGFLLVVFIFTLPLLGSPESSGVSRRVSVFRVLVHAMRNYL